VKRPRAADDFATIRARMEELRRERAQALKKESGDPDDTVSGGRNLLRGSEGRGRSEQERTLPGLPTRRLGSGR
jgi:hypothetical protein